MKISEIKINNYRAFYNEKGKESTKYLIDLKPGKNLLVYGENGSGKSSLFKGLRDLFKSSVESDYTLIRNAFSKDMELDDEPFVEITFDSIDGTKEPAEFRFSHDPHRTNTNNELLRNIVRSKSFMTYRDLMQIHFINQSEVNLFGFLFEADGLLTELPNPAYSRPETNLKMGELLKLVKESPDAVNSHDFSNGVNRILIDMNKYLNSLLGYFDKSMTIYFSELTEAAVEKGELIIRINVTYYDINLSEEVEQYHNFLNEARLSALAICIFLAARLSVPPAPYEILFLDDIFTGLDTSNRIPLLNILTDDVIAGTKSDTFKNHQIILTTYDKQWYELAKNTLGNGNWNYVEMYIDRHSNKFDQPAILPDEDDFEKALYYFKMHQYPACANYQRKICESCIKKFLPDYKKYDALSNGDIKPVNKLDTFITRLESYLTENSLSFEPFSRLKTCLRVVMNPLSHDDLESPVFRQELELVFDIIVNLQKLKNTVILDAGSKIFMKKEHAETGIEKEYICQLLSPLRKIECNNVIKYSKFKILPLTEKDGEGKKIKISHSGKFEDVYRICCHSLSIEPKNPFDDFRIKDGRSLSQIIS
jgi:energy-coupling factor transporter ATP-binding protein EcfA2